MQSEKWIILKIFGKIVEFVKRKGGLDYAVGRLEEYVKKACDALEVFPDSREKAFLKELAVFTARRKM